jgi:arabinofuranan 3-O-arabinosyltransferase
LRSDATSSAVQATAAVEVLDSSSTSMRVQVPASPAESWLVLGQSHSDGWQATADGDDLGAPLLVNGYANAWRLPAHEEPLEVTLRWTPQRVIDVALALSAIAFVVVLLLAWPRRRDQIAETSPTAVIDRRWTYVATGALLVFAGVVPAVLGLAAAELARRQERWRGRLLIVPVALLGVVAAIVVYKQARYDLPATLDWPQAFPWTHGLTWAAVAVATGLASVGERPPAA